MLRRRAPWVLGLIGLALVVVGVERVIATASGAGLVTVVVVGALLLISPFVIARLERLSAAASGFELGFARDLAGQGAPKAARMLDRTDLARFAESCEFARNELAGAKYGDARVYLEDRLIDQAAAIAGQEKFDAAEVRTLFASHSPAVRILAIGLMRGDPSLADGPTILAAIADPGSPNEQYQALELAKRRWPELSKSCRAAIHSMVASNSQPGGGQPRPLIADEILSLPLS